MPDFKYCYPDTDILINKLNIKDGQSLLAAEIKLTSIRLEELQQKPIWGKFDFNHLKAIHQYIFQDLFEWAGQVRTVPLSKGNLFCTVQCIPSYAESVFKKYYPQCYGAKDNFQEFVEVLAINYGDLNALHPFREGNGRAQREFARLVCFKCGYDFDLSCSTHKEMLDASILSFNKADPSGLIKIFSQAVSKHDGNEPKADYLKVLSTDDLLFNSVEKNKYFESDNPEEIETYNTLYNEKISQMNTEISGSRKKQ